MKKLVIYGAGGFGRELTLMIERINKDEPKYELLGFIDDGEDFKVDQIINGYSLLGRKEWFAENNDVSCVCAIANVNIRKAIQEELTSKGIEFETIIHPDVKIHKSNEIGKGCVIGQNCIFTTNIKVADGVFLNGSITLGHDARIGAFTTVMPGTGISGNCTVGELVNIGGHSFIVPNKRIGDHAVVAAGSIVFTNVKAGTTVLGNPAKRIRALED